MKKKVALLVGYNGEGYHGLQFNKDLPTIEKEVIRILLKHSCITELNSLDAQKIDLKSSSRTDKGVHASFNVMNVKIIRVPTKELCDELKKDFAEKGMILYKMITLPKSFLSYKQARSRVYKYTIPTYFLQEDVFEDDWKQFETKERNDLIETADGEEDDEKAKPVHNYSEINLEPLNNYKSDSIDIFRQIIEEYVGTHNFHNFTLKKTPGDVKRYMIDLKVSEPFIDDKVEYIEVTIHGQSFLLHQIRKMMSFAIINCKYFRSNYKENFAKVFSNDECHVPKSPSEYLFLHHVFFDDFNEKRKQANEEALEIDEQEKIEYEKKFIYPTVLKKNNLYEWLKFFDCIKLYHERFDYLN